MLKIGFVHSNNDIDVQWYRPLAYGYLKSYLLAGIDSPITMEFLESLDNIDVFDILAISSTSQNYSHAIEIARIAKEKKEGIIVILGGHHITYLPETMAEVFDIGVMGEGEETFLQLINSIIRNGCKVDKKALVNIKGLAYYNGNSVTTTGPREPIMPMDKIPHPSRDHGGTPYLFTSRGCPYKCSFCSSSAFWDKTRFFSAEYIVEEIEGILKDFPETTQIPIMDDLFIANKPRLLKFIKLMKEKKLAEKISFSFSIRANLVNDELCKILKDLKIVSVSFGAESGSDKTLNTIEKGTSAKQNQNAIDILNFYGYVPVCSFIVGIPMETENDVRKTYEFAIRNIDRGKIAANSAINILMPLPGTKMWDQTIAKGLVDPAIFEWKRLTAFASYLHSNLSSFSDWANYRRRINALYLAEDTLPQEDLYLLMEFYENLILKISEFTSLKNKVDHLEAIKMSRSWRITAPLRWLSEKYKSFRYGLKTIDDGKGNRITVFPESALAHKYCIGKGLEIGGAIHNPFGLDTINIDNTDSTETAFKEGEIKLCGKTLKVDLIANGDEIPFTDETQDFIVSSHVFEHLPNPIKALIEWDRVIKPGGIIFMIIPHKERTFDAESSRTTLAHLIEDFKNNEKKNDFNLVNGRVCHHHVWITEDIVELVQYMIEKMRMNWKLLEVQDIDDKVGNGFTIVLRKN